MSSLTIERITPDNYNIYADLVYRRVHGHDPAPEERGQVDPAGAAHARAELSRPDFYVYVAQVAGTPAGWIHAVYIPKIGRWKQGYLYVDELWVDPTYRHNGIGKALCEKINEALPQSSACKIRLYTDNPIAQRLYERCGWKTVNFCVFMESEDI